MKKMNRLHGGIFFFSGHTTLDDPPVAGVGFFALDQVWDFPMAL